MKARNVWLLAVAVLAIAALYFVSKRSGKAPPPTPETNRPSGLPVSPVPAPNAVAPQAAPVAGPSGSPSPIPPSTPAHPAPPAPANPEVPIQDAATIDFSIGAPVVRSGGADTEALNRALKEMEEATRNTTFPPRGEAQGTAPAR